MVSAGGKLSFVPARPLSNQPAAVNKRSYRARLRKMKDVEAELAQLRASMLGGKDTSSVVAPAPAIAGSASTVAPPAPASTPPSSSSSPSSTGALFTTKPIHGPGPDSFLRSAIVSRPGAKDGEGVPLVDGAATAAAAAAKPVTEAEAATVATALVMFFQLGAGELLKKRPSGAAELGKVVDPADAIVKFSGLLFNSTQALCFEHGITMRYANYAVVAVGLGVGAFGIAAKPEKDIGNDNARARAAKDANSKTAAAEKDTSDDTVSTKGASSDDDEELKL